MVRFLGCWYQAFHGRLESGYPAPVHFREDTGYQEQ
jgi:hypothetical protein